MQIAICEVLLDRHAVPWLGDFPFPVIFAILRSEEQGWFAPASHSRTAPAIYWRGKQDRGLTESVLLHWTLYQRQCWWVGKVQEQSPEKKQRAGKWNFFKLKLGVWQGQVKPSFPTSHTAQPRQPCVILLSPRSVFLGVTPSHFPAKSLGVNQGYAVIRPHWLSCSPEIMTGMCF